MYYQHFGLSGPPFSPAFSATPLFLGVGHREAMAALEWGLREPSGFTLLAGDAGTGKTTLILSLLARRPQGVRAAWVADPKLSFQEMLQVIAGQLNLRPPRTGRFELLQALDAFVAGLRPEESLALIFDEVQGLSDELLEELRLLRNVSSAGDKRLQIILVGHLDFVRRLGQPQLSQLNQRIGARAVLPVLQASEIRDYLDYRLRAQGSNLRKLFAGGAVRELVRHCGGIPRKINLLCDNALLGAYAQGARKVSFKHMNVAVRDYDNLLWATRDRSLLSRIRSLSWIRRGQGLTFTRLVIVCGLVLFALALCYRLNPVAVDALRLAARQRLAAILVNHANQVEPEIDGVLRSNNDGAARPAGMSSDKSAATAKPALQGSKPPASPLELVAQRVASSAAPGSTSPPQVELPQPQPPVPAAGAKLPAAAAADPVATAGHPAVVVKQGDSLSKIASHYFGSGGPEQVHSLIQANPQITDANRIYPGQIIYVRESRNGNQQ